MRKHMIFLDTNYLVRFFVRDIADQAEIARKLIVSAEKIYITTIVLAETVYILETHYKVTKSNLCTTLSSFIKQPNIVSMPFFQFALDVYMKENISFYDSLFLTEALGENSEIKSFDKKLMRLYSKYLRSLRN